MLFIMNTDNYSLSVACM